MNGADYIAEFLASKGATDVFLMTGGAAAFMIDAVARHKALRYHCFHHEQAAAMAADAAWRATKRVGVTMATSGPGATNLLTGIACSYFDSIPTIHITGQINLRERAALQGANPRQAGFQETDIVSMARPITNYAVQVHDGESLKAALAEAWTRATTGRMGPVLIDVPMNVQQLEIGDFVPAPAVVPAAPPASLISSTLKQIKEFLAGGERPLIYVGAGVGLAGVEAALSAWLKSAGIPFVSSWNGETYIDHDAPFYAGNVGVYGNRGAHFLVQNCDRLLVLGSRLDNRQRTGNPKQFAAQAKVLVLDIDPEELAKFAPDGYLTCQFDLTFLPRVLEQLAAPAVSEAWHNYVVNIKARYFDKAESSYAQTHKTASPYQMVRRLNELMDADAIVVNDTGAALCWFYQAFHRSNQTLFTAGGNSPMGYALPAAIGTKLVAPSRQVISMNGDGGFQLNIQELATLQALKLDMVIVIFNNGGYGIIRQFIDSNLAGRHIAVGDGMMPPDFKPIVEAYGMRYFRIEKPEQILPDMLRMKGGVVLDLIIDTNTPIEPKVELGRPIHDQSPRMSDEEFNAGNAFVKYTRK